MIFLRNTRGGGGDEVVALRTIGYEIPYRQGRGGRLLVVFTQKTSTRPSVYGVQAENANHTLLATVPIRKPSCVMLVICEGE